ncbi:Extracellular matrix protein 1 [Liparis tanakae]|uniref:Extracellular matrix protein 1 n=1 Tax=Liparis tanakae TaxID=230148 RepID=A0A4Z2ICR0_9TELE|nr:Extracellular matrix protein 1 [Liparis tanakae]
MSHVEKTSSTPTFPPSASSPLKANNNHKVIAPRFRSRRRTARKRLLDQLPAAPPSVLRVFLGGLCSLCQGREEQQRGEPLRTDAAELTMGSSGALLCCTAWVVILLSSASTDDRDMEQREVIFDKIMQDFPEQVETTNSRGLPDFVPRSSGGPPMLNYPVEFPLGRPTSDNLQAICLNREYRPSYSKSYFPVSGFGQLKNMAKTVNTAESWLSTCCKGNQTWEKEVTLCCATKAWELSVRSFCQEDVSIKHRIYHCCFLRGDDMLNCFQNDAPNPNYEATEELPVPPLPSTDTFSFDPNTCQRTVMTPHSVRGNRGEVEKKPSAPPKVDMSFPPGRPTADTIETLCRNRKHRPLYKTNCLTGLGYEWLARQAKTINRIEKGFKQCCKKNQRTLNCADQKSFVNQCCPLSEDHKTACFEQKIEKISEMCSSRKTLSPAVRRCCLTSSQRFTQCFSKTLLDAISKATTVLRQKKKKRCPLS